MFTRKDYALDGKCIYQQYYAQFVTEEIKMIVVLNFGLDTLEEVYQEDKTFNIIPLHSWDSCRTNLGYNVRDRSFGF